MERKLIGGILAVITIIGVFLSCSDTMQEDIRDKIKYDQIAAGDIQSYTITYSGNGNTLGEVPVDSNLYIKGDIAVVIDNINGLIKPGYSFTGWNTKADGSGTSYSAEEELQIPDSDILLFAVWQANIYTITYDKNDAEATGSMPVQELACEATASLYNCLFLKPDHTCIGWALTSDGNVAYGNKADITMGTSDITLYAKWVEGYKITFYKNDINATGTMDIQIIGKNSSANLDPCEFTKTGWSFKGWDENSDGTVDYVNGASYEMGIADVELYAIWGPNDYTVSFDPEGGSSADSVTVTYDSAYGTLPTSTRTGYTFDGWWNGDNGTGTEITAATIVKTANNHTLYAKWLSQAKAITSFTFASPSATGTIDEPAKTVNITVPYTTDRSSLVPSIIHTGASVNPASGTANDFNTSALYTVTAEDSSTQGYTIYANRLPGITTASVNSITAASAVSGGNVTDQAEGGAVTARGICWSSSANPTTADSKTIDGSGTGSFVSNISGLSLNTTYYVRAYAVNDLGTSYGEQVVFSTNLPVLTTTEVTNITGSSASSGGNISSGGGSSVTARGVCWSTSSAPTTSGSITTDGTGSGSFSSSVTGLSEGTTYYLRAYATNSIGTSYGSEISFTTQTYPRVSTSAVSDITTNTASCGGNVTSTGSSTVTARGLCWSTIAEPTTLDSKTIDGNGIGSFISSITELSPGTTYYVRAYATSSAGTIYGNQNTFTTQLTTPTVTTTAISNITSSGATGGGNVTSDGGATVTARGICWSTSSNPTTTNTHTSNGTGTGSFTSSISGTSIGTTYFVRAYATNSVGTVYGNEVSFTPELPSVTTTTIVGNTSLTIYIGGTTARGAGNVTSQGSSSVTTRGVCWNTTGNPTIGNPKSASGSGTGSFTATMSSLSTNTTYYIRAYATNSVGTTYGNQVSFNSGRTFGNSYAGGEVFYNNGSGGGIVALTDPLARYGFSNVYNSFIGGTSTAIGTGEANTTAIINQPGHTHSAARICANYSDGTYDDWYLPSASEMLALKNNLLISLTYHTWTSSEYNSTQARYITSTGGLLAQSKTTYYDLYAVRNF